MPVSTTQLFAVSDLNTCFAPHSLRSPNRRRCLWCPALSRGRPRRYASTTWLSTTSSRLLICLRLVPTISAASATALLHSRIVFVLPASVLPSFFTHVNTSCLVFSSFRHLTCIVFVSYHLCLPLSSSCCSLSLRLSIWRAFTVVVFCDGFHEHALTVRTSLCRSSP